MTGKRIQDLTVGEYAERINVITQEDARNYAAITGDNNPLHFETEEAYQSRYGKPIAHGMILAGFISGVIGAALPGPGCIYQSQSMDFLLPVYYNDTILTRVTVIACNPERNRLTLRTECFNQNQELIVTGEALVLPRK